MTRRILPLLSLFALLTVFAACKKDKNISYGTDATRGYFPLSLGHYITYDVDSTVWGEPAGTKRLAHYQMRYTISDTFMDLQHRPSYRVDAIIRNSDSSQWRTSDVFYVTPTAASIIVVQNNLTFTKLVFPVENGTTWQGNSAIATADADLSYYYGWNYMYSAKGASYDDGRTSFDNTVTVQEVNDTSVATPETNPASFSYRTFSKEMYAYNVGLVYREYVHWVYDPTSVQPPTPAGRVGTGVVMRAVDNN